MGCWSPAFIVISRRGQFLQQSGVTKGNKEHNKLCVRHYPHVLCKWKCSSCCSKLKRNKRLYSNLGFSVTFSGCLPLLLGLGYLTPPQYSFVCLLPEVAVCHTNGRFSQHSSRVPLLGRRSLRSIHKRSSDGCSACLHVLHCLQLMGGRTLLPCFRKEQGWTLRNRLHRIRSRCLGI